MVVRGEASDIVGWLIDLINLFYLIPIICIRILQYFCLNSQIAMSIMTNEYDFVFKVLLIGNSSVGKSSLLLRFSDNVFHEAFLPTIGVDFKIRTIEHAGSLIKLQMWDTAGQQKFKTITSAYYRGAQGIVLVFDLCDKNTLNDVRNWISECQKYSNNKELVKILVGNKSDLKSQRQVSREEAEMFAENEGMKYIETSAKSNTNVQIIFQTLSSQMKSNFLKPNKPENKPKNILKPILPVKNPKKTTCC